MKNYSALGAMMKYEREAAAPASHPPEHTKKLKPFPGSIAQRMIPRRSSGWDPYEVWRTRIKAPRDQSMQPLDLDKAV